MNNKLMTFDLHEVEGYQTYPLPEGTQILGVTVAAERLTLVCCGDPTRDTEVRAFHLTQPMVTNIPRNAVFLGAGRLGLSGVWAVFEVVRE